MDFKSLTARRRQRVDEAWIGTRCCNPSAARFYWLMRAEAGCPGTLDDGALVGE